MERQQPDWSEYAALGVLRAVIDPLDEQGVEKDVIDRKHWLLVRPHLGEHGRVLELDRGTGRMAARRVGRGSSTGEAARRRRRSRQRCRTTMTPPFASSAARATRRRSPKGSSTHPRARGA